jgi:hypothetical protein
MKVKLCISSVEGELEVSDYDTVGTDQVDVVEMV